MNGMESGARRNRDQLDIALTVIKFLVTATFIFWLGKMIFDHKEAEQTESRVAQGISEANVLVNDGNYEEALSVLYSLEQGTKYDDRIAVLIDSCEDKMAATVIEEARILASNSAYEEAMDKLESLTSVPKSRNSEYVALSEQIIASYRASVINKVSECIAADNLGAAVGVLDRAVAYMPEDVEISALLQEYKSQYEKAVLGDIQDVYENEGIGAVVARLETASKNVPSDELIASELELWKQRSVPVNLVSLEEFYKDCYVHTSNSEGYKIYGIDNQGNNYETFIGGGSDDYIEYKIGGYGAKRLCCTVYVTEDCAAEYPEESHRYDDTAIIIYGDGQILYSLTSGDWGQKMEPKEIALDISGVDYIKIEFPSELGMVSLGNPAISW